MMLRYRCVTYVAIIFCGVVCAVASGQNSVQADSSQLVLASDQGFDARLEPEAILMTGDLFESGYQSTMPHTNWQFGAEFLIYDMKYGNVNFEDAEGDNKLASGLRIFFGWESDAGYGIRAIGSGSGGETLFGGYHWNYAVPGDFTTLQGFDFSGAPPGTTVDDLLEISMSTSSIDVFRHIQRERLDLFFGVGVGGASVRLNAPTMAVKNSLIAGGLSVFSEGRYVLRASEVSELALVGRGRIAFLSGEWEARINNLFLDKDMDLTVTEGALGLEWKRKLRRSTLILRAQYEHQLWNSDATSDLVLNGVALRAGLTW